MKICTKCNIKKDNSQFHKDKTNKDGYCAQCKICKKEYRDNNKQRFNESRRKWGLKNPNYNTEHSRKYRKENPGYNAWQVSKRKKRIKQATLPGFDTEIKEIYLNCPEGHHVDHIMPINHPDLCGLHVPWNLQYLPAEENLKKGNKIPNYTLKGII